MPYYAVAKGSKTGVYNNWSDCKAQVNGYSGASFKKFNTAAEANAFVSSGGNSSGVYVDGASRGNGKSANAPSGYGVYWGPNDPRNAAVPLDKVDRGTSFKPTNQRAELRAINHALKDIHNDLKSGNASTKTEIHSDSRYAIRSVDEWSDKWAANGWKNSKGEPVANQELIKETVALKNSINKEYQARNWGDVEFVHVKGHSGNPGNEAADRLANQGADNYGKYK
ncbi:Ribonuclease H [Candida tropicalis]